MNDSPISQGQTAQTVTPQASSVPAPSFGTNLKATYAPTTDDLQNYLYSKGYESRMMPDGHLYITTPGTIKQGDTEADIYSKSQQFNPGFLANMTHGALPAIGQTIGAIVGTPADAVTGGVPAGTVVGAGLGAGIGSSANQVISHKLFPQKDTVTGQDVRNVGVDTALGATSPFVNKYVLDPLLARPITNLANAIPGKFAAKVGLGEESEVPYLGGNVNVGAIKQTLNRTKANDAAEQMQQLLQDHLVGGGDLAIDGENALVRQNMYDYLQNKLAQGRTNITAESLLNNSKTPGTSTSLSQQMINTLLRTQKAINPDNIPATDIMNDVKAVPKQTADLLAQINPNSIEYQNWLQRLTNAPSTSAGSIDLTRSLVNKLTNPNPPSSSNNQ